AEVAEQLRKPQAARAFTAGRGIDVDETSCDGNGIDRVDRHARAAAPRSFSFCSTVMIFSREAALGGTSGRRYTSSTRPIAAIAALTGIGFDSTKFTWMNGSSQ